MVRGRTVQQLRQAEGITRKATRRALNTVARQATTETRRSLSKATGITQTKLRPYISTRTASYTDLSSAVRVKPHVFNIASSGGRQTKKGVSAAAWGKRRVYPHTFLIRGVTAMVRVGKARLPIRPVYGARVHREFAQPAITAALETLVRLKLPGIMKHELEFALQSIGVRR